MSTFEVTIAFLPTEVSDAGLAELRRLALEAADAAARFSTWLHGWCDAEQARRAKREATCTHRHALGVPMMADWSNREVGESLEAVGVLACAVSEFTASMFAERLQLALTMEAGHRLRLEGKSTAMKTEAKFFTVKGLCSRYGVVPITIRRWIVAGVFPPPMRIGRRRCYWPVETILEHERRAMEQARKFNPEEKPCQPTL